MEIKALYKKFLKHKQISAPKNKVQSKKPIAVSGRGLWDKSKKKVIVPSNRITMKGPNGEQDFFKRPVLATGLQSGKQVMMQPGGEYYFPEDRAVVERRMQGGGWYNEAQWDSAVTQAALDNLPKVAQNKVSNPGLSVSAPQPRGLGYSMNPSINKQRPGSLQTNPRPEPTEQPRQSEEIDITDAVKGLRPQEPKFSGLKNVLNTADLVTDVMQLGHFVPHPIGQAVGYAGDYLGAGVDFVQSGINLAEGDYEGALINAALGRLPAVTSKQGYKRSNSLINHTTPGTHRPLTSLPHLRNNPVVQKGLMWNRATLGANALEIGSNLNFNNTQSKSPVRDQDNTTTSQDNTRMSPNIRPFVPKMQKGGTVPTDYSKFQEFNKTLPENLRDDNFNYNDSNSYDLYGMWEGSGKPNSFKDVQDGDFFPLQEDGTYHGFSVNPETGEFLKPKNHSTTWMEVKEGQLNPDLKDQLIIQNERGRLQYVPRTMQDGGTVQTNMLQPIKKDEDSLPILMDSLFSQFQKTKQEFGAQPEEELQMQDGAETGTEENPEQIAEVNVQAPQRSWFDRNIERPLRKWGRSYAKRISDQTGGSEWYKKPNSVASAFFSTGPGFVTEAPQLSATYAVTGKVQTPSEAMDIQNPYLAFLVDAGLDPADLVGAGIGKKLGLSSLSNMVTSAPGSTVSLKRKIPFPTYMPTDGIDYMKKWVSHPEYAKRYNNYAKIKDGITGKDMQDFNVSQLERYKHKDYNDLLKEEDQKYFNELKNSTYGASFGDPNRIYIDRDLINKEVLKTGIEDAAELEKLRKFNLSNTEVHELSHLLDQNNRNFTQGEIDAISKVMKPMPDGRSLASEFDNFFYYTDPTEVRARMNEARFRLNLEPDQKFTDEMFNTISKDTNWDGMGPYITDKEKFINLMNTLRVVPLAGAAGVGVSQMNNQRSGMQMGGTMSIPGVNGTVVASGSSLYKKAKRK